MKNLYTLSLLIVLLVLTSCQSSSSGFNEVIRVGVSADYPPFVNKDKMGQLEGMEIDFAFALAAELGCRVEFVERPFQDIFTSLQRGDFDIAMAGLAPSPSRQRQFTFIKPYMETDQMAFVRRADIVKLKRPGQGHYLNTNHVWGMIKGSETEERFIKYLKPKQMKAYKDVKNGLLGLRNKEITGFVCDAPVIWNYTQKNPFSDITGFYWGIYKERLSWAVAKPSPFSQRLNQIVTKWHQDGTIGRITNRWAPYRVEFK